MYSHTVPGHVNRSGEPTVNCQARLWLFRGQKRFIYMYYCGVRYSPSLLYTLDDTHACICVNYPVTYYCRLCFFTASSLNAKNKFIDQINYSFGGGAMSCGFESNNHVAFFIQFLKRNSSLPLKDAVTISGRQPSGIYAMNSECFIDANGKKIDDPSCVAKQGNYLRW